MKTIHIPNCWICGRAVSLGNSKIDENHLAVHESCYVAKKGRSQPSTPQKATILPTPMAREPGIIQRMAGSLRHTEVKTAV